MCLQPKRKRSPTAYMMWCNAKRPEVVANHPGIGKLNYIELFFTTNI